MQSTPMKTEADAEAAIKKALCIADNIPTLVVLTVSSAEGTETGETRITAVSYTHLEWRWECA